MPRSSRSKSHKQSSKHSSKETTKDYSENSEEDVVKMKERNGKEEKENSVRVSRDSVSGEKRKVSSSSKDLSGHGNGDVSEEYLSSKRRKEKSERWNGDERSEELSLKGENSDKVLSKSKDSSSKVVAAESKSKSNSSSRRHDEKKEENLSSVAVVDKCEPKRKSEKESSGRKESQSKEKDREKKVQDGEVARKQGEEQHSKKGKENTDWPIEEELRNPELEKELEKRIKRRGEGSSEKDRYQDDGRESDGRRVYNKGDRSKDVKYKDESHGDKYREDGERENRHREDKYKEDGDRENKSKDLKYREDGDRDNRHKDEKYREDGDRDRHRDDKYREDGRDNRYKEDRYREDGDRDTRRRDDKYREGGDRDERNRDDKHRQDSDRDYRHKEDKHRDDVDRDSRHRDSRARDDADRDKRAREAKYRDVHSSRDHESETKRLRDDSNASDLHYRKSNNRDASPTYDDRTRYKDDKDRRRVNDREDPNDFRTRSSKDQRSDVEKRPASSAKVDLVADRGRANSRNTDLDVSANHSRRRSPSTSAYAARDARDHRVSKQEETKYRDYVYEERMRHNVTSSREFAPGHSEKISSSRSMEKGTQKDDGYVGELSVERRVRSDVRASPLVDKSPSSTSNDRRHLNRSDVRRNLDVEESGQRSAGSKEAKEYSGKDGKGRDLPLEGHLIDDISQADGDTMSVSSPYNRNSHFSGNSKSLLPPPHRSGGDSPSGFGSAEDDNRKLNNRHRRMTDPNMGRVQSGWKGVPNWPSPMANGYLPFQHGPPPVGFHQVMPQFSPQMFGVRPTMKLNHTGLPYHISDGDRFSSHGVPLGWRNRVDDSIPPPLHGWDANTPMFGDESHLYGRVDWDRGRNQLSNRGWESSDMWKGQNIGGSLDLQSAPPKDEYSAHRSADEIWSAQKGPHIENELNQTDLQADINNMDQMVDVVERETPEAPVPDSPYVSKIPREDNSRISQIYLSKVDISADLTEPDLYDQCSNMVDLDKTPLSDEFDCKILILEEGVEAEVKIPIAASLFTAIDDTVFQKAMSLYKKQKEEFGAINGVKVSSSDADVPELAPASDCATGGSDGVGMPGDEADGLAPNDNQEEENLLVSNVQKPLDEADVMENMEETPEDVSTSGKVAMEVDPIIPKQEEADLTIEEKTRTMEGLSLVCKVEEVDENNVATTDTATIEEISKEEIESVETKCGGSGDGGPLHFSGVSSEACEMLIESGSVNLSRIHHHHSPESTH